MSNSSPAPTTHSPVDSQGSFLNGFTLGLFAGAAGYFLFGTKKGQSFRKQVSSEWEEAKQTLADKGVIESSNMSLRDCITSVVNTVAKHVDPSLDHSNHDISKVKVTVKSKGVKSESKPDKRRLFKNT